MRNVFPCVCSFTLLVLLVLGDIAWAQQPGSVPPQSASSDADKPSNREQSTGGHVVGFIPNHLTVEDPMSHPPALTAKQKFSYMLENTFDPFEFGIVGAFAAVGQARNDPKSWGQGWGAFSKRYAASFADQADWNVMVEAALPSLLKEDPRYYRMGQGGVLKRTGYAVSRIWVTGTDSGHKTFNFPEIAGAGLSSGISNAYYPRENRTVSKNLSRWGVLLGEVPSSTSSRNSGPIFATAFPRSRMRGEGFEYSRLTQPVGSFALRSKKRKRFQTTTP